MWWSHEAVSQEGVPLAQALVGYEEEEMSYGRSYYETVYCAGCNLALGEQEKRIVIGDNKYHDGCEPKMQDSEHGDNCVFIGLAVVVIGFLFS